MKRYEQRFNTRQYMIKGDFEFFHYKDDTLIEVEYHNHQFYEVFLLISGKVSCVIEGKTYRLKPGDIVLVNDRELHKSVMEPGEVYERYVVWIHPEFLKQLGSSADLSLCFNLSARKRHNLLRAGTENLMVIKSIVSRLEKAYYSSQYGSDILRRCYLSELLVFLNRAVLDARNEDIETDIEYNRKINGVIRYINDNLHEELSLDALASLFYISKYHLLREFKKNTGYTIHQYIQKKRLILASLLLRDNMKVTDVSALCGFRDYSNFIRAFKNEFGYPPKQYARESRRFPEAKDLPD